MSTEAVNDAQERAPHPRLRPFITSYQGYRVSGLRPGTHAGLPSSSLTFIVAFDDPLDLARAPDGSTDSYWAMVAGLHRRPALVRHEGRQHGVQLAITPRGASALFGVPAAALASTAVHLDQLVPVFADELIERLSNAASWRARFAVLDDVFLRVLNHDRELPAELEQAWQALTVVHGARNLDDLAREIGWSRRHLTERFRDTFGMTPKVMARILRFERAQQMMRLPTAPSLSSVAAACGYADQAHMTREWTEFAGEPPTAWLQDELLPNVQDPETPLRRR